MMQKAPNPLERGEDFLRILNEDILRTQICLKEVTEETMKKETRQQEIASQRAQNGATNADEHQFAAASAIVREVDALHEEKCFLLSILEKLSHRSKETQGLLSAFGASQSQFDSMQSELGVVRELLCGVARRWELKTEDLRKMEEMENFVKLRISEEQQEQQKSDPPKHWLCKSEIVQSFEETKNLEEEMRSLENLSGKLHLNLESQRSRLAETERHLLSLMPSCHGVGNAIFATDTSLIFPLPSTLP